MDYFIDYFTNENIIKSVGMNNILLFFSVILIVISARLIYIERTIARFRKNAKERVQTEFYARSQQVCAKICTIISGELLSAPNISPQLQRAVVIAEEDVKNLWVYSPTFEVNLLHILESVHNALPTIEVGNVHGIIEDGFGVLHGKLNNIEKDTKSLKELFTYLTRGYISDLNFSNNLCSSYPDRVKKELLEYLSKYSPPQKQPCKVDSPTLDGFFHV